MKESQMWRKVAERVDRNKSLGLCMARAETALPRFDYWSGLGSSRLNDYLSDIGEYIGSDYVYPMFRSPTDVTEGLPQFADMSWEETVNARVLAALWMELEAEEDEKKELSNV